MKIHNENIIEENKKSNYISNICALTNEKSGNTNCLFGVDSENIIYLWEINVNIYFN
jgi:hypothetical protein